jgi:hypothetical protein
MNRLPGHLTKSEVAERLGVKEKTIDRRRKVEPLLSNWVKAGKHLWLPEQALDRYLEYAMKRGRV